jgi:hypothetical protein
MIVMTLDDNTMLHKCGAIRHFTIRATAGTLLAEPGF